MVAAGYEGGLHKLCSHERSEGFHRRARCRRAWRRALRSSKGIAPRARASSSSADGRCLSSIPASSTNISRSARPSAFLTSVTWARFSSRARRRTPSLIASARTMCPRRPGRRDTRIDFVPPAPWGARPRAVPPEIEGWGKSNSPGVAIPPARDPSVASGRASFLVTRTGYTGEAGFELFPTPAEGSWVWESLLKSGADLGIKPIGLGARDTLRLEKGYLLSGQDFDGHQTPLEVNCAWVVKWGRPFIGREALEAQRARDDYPRLVGVRMEDRGGPRPGHRVLSRGVDIGQVTSGTMSPSLRVGIALASVDRGHASPDARLENDVRGTPHAARVVPLPFL